MMDMLYCKLQWNCGQTVQPPGGHGPAFQLVVVLSYCPLAGPPSVQSERRAGAGKGGR
jgi:hypothetical protein